jgi:hypothetical protein
MKKRRRKPAGPGQPDPQRPLGAGGGPSFGARAPGPRRGLPPLSRLQLWMALGVVLLLIAVAALTLLRP